MCGCVEGEIIHCHSYCGSRALYYSPKAAWFSKSHTAFPFCVVRTVLGIGEIMPNSNGLTEGTPLSLLSYYVHNVSFYINIVQWRRPQSG